MAVIAKYRFHKQYHSDLLPLFNNGYVNYTYSDEIDDSNLLEVQNITWEPGVLADGWDAPPSTEYPDSVRTGYIEIKPGYSYFGSHAVWHVWYDASKNFISEILTNTGDYVIAPPNAHFVRLYRAVQVDFVFKSAVVTRTIQHDTLPTGMRFSTGRELGNQSDYERALLEVLEMNTSQLIAIDYMFRGCTNLISIQCNWDTSNVTDMSAAFQWCHKLGFLDTSNWDTSNVINFTGTFDACRSLSNIDTSNWDVSSVLQLYAAFRDCTGLAYLDLRNWNTVDCLNFHSFLSGCTGLTTLDISNFSIHSSSVTDSLLNASNLKYIKCGNSSTIQTLIPFLSDRTSTDPGIIICQGGFISSSVLDSLAAKNWQVVSETQTVAKYMFDSSVHSNLIPQFNNGYMAFVVDQLPDLESGDTTITRTLEHVILPTLMRFGLDYSHIAPNPFSESLLRILELDTSQLTTLHCMFRWCTQVTDIACKWRINNVTNMSSVFADCHNLLSVDLDTFDTSNATDISGLFFNCGSIKSLDLSSLKTGSVTKLNNVFRGCSSLTSLDIGHWDTRLVTSMYKLFDGCQALETLDISNFTIAPNINLDDFFLNTYALKDIGAVYCDTNTLISIGNKIPLSQVVTVWCNNLTTDLPDFTNVHYALYSEGREFNLTSPLLEGDQIVMHDGKLCHYHKMAMVVLDGSEDWVRESWSDILRFKLAEGAPKCLGGRWSKDYSNLYIKLHGDQSGIEYFRLDNNTNTHELYVYKTNLSLTLNEFKKSLQANPTTVVYELAEPWYEPIGVYGKVVLDGSQNYLHLLTNTANYSVWRVTGIDDLKMNGTLFSSDITTGQFDSSTINERKICSSTEVQGFSLALEGSITNASQYLQQNPVTVIYELAEPQYITSPIVIESKETNIVRTNSESYASIQIHNRALETSLIKPDTTYTLAFDNTVEGKGLFIEMNGAELESTNNIVKITTPASVDNSGLVISGEGTISNIRLLEGDVIEDCIPKQSFEGLKSSFEDGYIPESMVNDNRYCCVLSITEPDGKRRPFEEMYPLANGNRVRSDLIEVKPNTAYTLYSPGYITTIHEYNSDIIWIKDHLWQDTDTYTFSTRSDCTGLVVYIKKSDNSIFTEGEANSVPMILSLEEDFNHLGKYKVECKVTGKNKFNSNALIKQTSVIIEDGTIELNYDRCTTDFIKVKPNTTYTKRPLDGFQNVWTTFYDVNKNYLGEDLTRVTVYSNTFVTPSNTYYVRNSIQKQSMTDEEFLFIQENWQLEEGEVATEYEPYKEDIKTYYLSSPLLEGDTIEDINGKATHVKRYEKVVLDGSEDWLSSSYLSTNVIRFWTREYEGISKGYASLYCDKFINEDDVETYRTGDKEMIHHDNQFNIVILKSRLSSLDTAGFSQWLQQNPTTVVYELASPIYEPISEQPLLMSSYAGGHLDYNTNIPTNKTVFRGLEIELIYLKPNTEYLVQFESDVAGLVNMFFTNGVEVLVSTVVGSNKAVLTTPHTLVDNIIHFGGLGVNISKVQVVQTPLETSLQYFKGIKSSLEFDDNTTPYLVSRSEEVNGVVQEDKKEILYYDPSDDAWKAPVLRAFDSIEKHPDGKYYYHVRSGEVVLDGSEDEEYVVYRDNDVCKSVVINHHPITPKEATGICNNFLESSNNVYNGRGDGIWTNPSTNRLYVSITKQRLGSLTFKQWFQQNPTSVVYELAQEQVFECTNLDLISYRPLTHYLIEAGIISPTSTISIVDNIYDSFKILQEKVADLEVTNTKISILLSNLINE